MTSHTVRCWLSFFVTLLLVQPCIADDLREEARQAMQHAVEFYSTKVAVHGAWVEDGTLKYYGKGDDTSRVITSQTFIKQLKTLSRYVASTKSE